jgi:cell division protein FtsB
VWEQAAKKCASMNLASIMRSASSSPRWVIYLFAGLLVGLGLFTAFGERGVFHLWRLYGEKQRLEERNFVLQKENETLRERIRRIRDDDLYLEKIAREELGLVRPGEIVYRFAAPDSERKTAQPASESPERSE